MELVLKKTTAFKKQQLVCTYICPVCVAKYSSFADLRNTEYMNTAGTTLLVVPAAEIQAVVALKQLSIPLKHLEKKSLFVCGTPLREK